MMYILITYAWYNESFELQFLRRIYCGNDAESFKDFGESFKDFVERNRPGPKWGVWDVEEIPDGEKFYKEYSESLYPVACGARSWKIKLELEDFDLGGFDRTEFDPDET